MLKLSQQLRQIQALIEATWVKAQHSQINNINEIFSVDVDL